MTKAKPTGAKTASAKPRKPINGSRSGKDSARSTINQFKPTRTVEDGHHKVAAAHHEAAAKHHHEADKHVKAGNDEKATDHAHAAHAHLTTATAHTHKAAEKHATMQKATPVK